MNETQFRMLFGVLNVIIKQLNLIIKIMMFSKIGAFRSILGDNPAGLHEFYQSVDSQAQTALNETEPYRRIK